MSVEVGPDVLPSKIVAPALDVPDAEKRTARNNGTTYRDVTTLPDTSTHKNVYSRVRTRILLLRNKQTSRITWKFEISAEHNVLAPAASRRRGTKQSLGSPQDFSENPLDNARYWKKVH